MNDPFDNMEIADKFQKPKPQPETTPEPLNMDNVPILPNHDDNAPEGVTKEELKKLSYREKLFADEYLKDGNATQAAKRAGYSKSNAHDTGHKILHRDHVGYYIECETARRAERTHRTADKVLNEYAKLAFMNVKSMEGKTLSEMAVDDLACISSITRKRNDNTGEVEETVKFHDKIAALRDLGKHLKLFSEKTEQDTQIIVKVTKAPDRIKRPPKPSNNAQTGNTITSTDNLNASNAPSNESNNNELPEFNPDAPEYDE